MILNKYNLGIIISSIWYSSILYAVSYYTLTLSIGHRHPIAMVIYLLTGVASLILFYFLIERLVNKRTGYLMYIFYIVAIVISLGIGFFHLAFPDNMGSIWTPVIRGCKNSHVPELTHKVTFPLGCRHPNITFSHLPSTMSYSQEDRTFYGILPNKTTNVFCRGSCSYHDDTLTLDVYCIPFTIFIDEPPPNHWDLCLQSPLVDKIDIVIYISGVFIVNLAVMMMMSYFISTHKHHKSKYIYRVDLLMKILFICFIYIMFIPFCLYEYVSTDKSEDIAIILTMVGLNFIYMIVLTILYIKNTFNREILQILIISALSHMTIFAIAYITVIWILYILVFICAGVDIALLVFQQEHELQRNNKKDDETSELLNNVTNNITNYSDESL